MNQAQEEANNTSSDALAHLDRQEVNAGLARLVYRP
jgi:hypothetical protein